MIKYMQRRRKMSEVRKRRYKDLEELYYSNYKLVYVMAADYTENADMKNEAAYCLWEKISQNPERYLSMDEYQLKNYIRVMVKNIFMDHFKREKRETVEFQEEHFKGALPVYFESENDWRSDELACLGKAKNILTLEEKELIFFRFEEGMSARQVSELFDTSEGNIRVRQKRILDKLRKEILRLMKEDIHI